MIIQTADRLGDTKEYYFSKKLREIAEMNESGTRVINLGIGSPDRPPHPDVVETLYETAKQSDVHGYQSYKGAPELRNAFSKWYKQYFDVTLDANKEVLPLIGSKEGIMHISMTFLNKGDEVLVPDPGYPSYRAASNLAGATCIPYDLREDLNWQPDFEALEQRDLSRVKIMWINYPQMPTGAKANPELFKKLIAFAKQNQILLCHDNPYSFILPTDNEIAPQPLSILSIEGADGVALELNSLSKSHNMAGWRIGVLAANEEIIQHVMRFKSNMDSGTFLPMQRAAAHALSLDSTWYKTLNEAYIKRKEKVKELLDLIGCSYKAGQQGLFVWAKVSDEYKDGYALSDRFLYDARVFITPGGIFGKNGNQFVRISLCSTVDTLEKAISRIEEVLEKKNHPQKISISE